MYIYSQFTTFFFWTIRNSELIFFIIKNWNVNLLKSSIAFIPLLFIFKWAIFFCNSFFILLNIHVVIPNLIHFFSKKCKFWIKFFRNSKLNGKISEFLYDVQTPFIQLYSSYLLVQFVFHFAKYFCTYPQFMICFFQKFRNFESNFFIMENRRVNHLNSI